MGLEERVISKRLGGEGRVEASRETSAISI